MVLRLGPPRPPALGSLACSLCATPSPSPFRPPPPSPPSAHCPDPAGRGEAWAPITSACLPASHLFQAGGSSACSCALCVCVAWVGGKGKGGMWRCQEACCQHRGKGRERLGGCMLHLAAIVTPSMGLMRRAGCSGQNAGGALGERSGAQAGGVGRTGQPRRSAAGTAGGAATTAGETHV